MSLYGLDIIENEGKRTILEINGINSGMQGFEQIYGDDRVQRQVFDMLKEKYGKLTVDDGTFSRNKYKKEHPVKFARNRAVRKIPLLRNIVFPLPKILLSQKAEIRWLKDKISYSNPPFEGFEIYDGQESAVINSFNQRLKHPLVNNFLSECIARNKFMQYMILKDSEIAESVIPSMLVGLGVADNKTLDKLLLWQNLTSSSKNFAAKPILGNQGRGLRFLSQEESVSLYRDSGGAVYDSSLMESFFNLAELLFHKSDDKKEIYLEDLVSERNFNFEFGLSLLQPFIESKRAIDGEDFYSSIRAIVCNGSFVDAYERISKDKKVNLSHNAKAIELDYDSNFADFCENAVRVFEKETQELDEDFFKESLYFEYLNGTERPSKNYRIIFEEKLMSAAIDFFANFVEKK